MNALCFNLRITFLFTQLIFKVLQVDDVMRDLCCSVFVLLHVLLVCATDREERRCLELSFHLLNTTIEHDADGLTHLTETKETKETKD
jgi:hypothetical protein